MPFISRRSIAAVAIASVATFPFLGATAEARTTHTAKAAHSQAAKAKSKHVKKFHAKFVVVGRVKAVSENSITVTVKGGNLKKSVRGKDIVLAVTETTTITVGDATKTLADVLVGDRVAVKGTRALSEGVVAYTAKRVHVKHPKTDADPVATPTATTITS